MSAKITVSYTDDQELQNIIKHLNPITHHIKRYKSIKGEYKKAEIRIKE